MPAIFSTPEWYMDDTDLPPKRHTYLAEFANHFALSSVRNQEF
jgi:hypothetical protein